jgi:drug/metabolite transporter (DMT)-like permease
VSWWLLALAAGVASALNVAASKRLVARVRPAVLGGVVHVTGGVLCLALLPLVGADLAPAAGRAPHLASMTGVYVVGNLLYFAALARTQLSEIDLFLRSSALWTVVGGAALLGESFPPAALVGVVLVLASLATVAERPRRLRLSGAQGLALGAAIAFGIGNVVDKSISGPFDPLGYTALNLVLTGIGMLVVARPRASELRAPALWRPTAWTIAATFALTQWLLILAFAAGGSAGGVILLAQVRLVVLMLVGVLLLGERDRLGRKAVAAVLMVLGVAALVGGR